MKKRLALCFAVLYVATALAGCHNTSAQDTTAPLETSAETTVETTAETTVETTTETTVEATTEETVPETTQAPTPTNPAPTTPAPTTPAPTVTPAPAGSHAIAGAVAQSGAVSASYFDDAVFVGDSISLKLSYYEAAVDKLGGAQFLTSGSLGSGNALWEVSSQSVHPTYQGQKMKLEDSIPLIGAKKLYIMLGMNDIGLYGVDGAVANMKTLLGKIQAAVPGITVYVQSMTPTTNTSNITSSGGINQTNIRRYNEALASACQANGWYFVNVAEVMYDSNGYLIRSYCSDADGMGIHFTEAGCEAWIQYLYTHTAG